MPLWALGEKTYPYSDVETFLWHTSTSRAICMTGGECIGYGTGFNNTFFRDNEKITDKEFSARMDPFIKDKTGLSPVAPSENNESGPDFYGPIIGAVGGWIVLLYLITKLRRRRLMRLLPAIWKEFALRNGLRFTARKSGVPSISGEYGGVKLLATIKVEKDDDEGPTTKTNFFDLKMDIAGIIPQGFELEGRSRLMKALGFEDDFTNVRTGDPKLHSRVMVYGEVPEEVLSYLTPERTEAALRLSSLGAVVTDGKVRFRNWHIPCKYGDITVTLDAFAKVVRALGT